VAREELNTCELKSIDVVVSFQGPKITAATVGPLAKRLRKPLVGRKATGQLVAASLLPEQRDEQYYVWFHVDLMSEPETDWLFVHAKYLRHPDTNPPRALRDAQRDGNTVTTFANWIEKTAKLASSTFVHFTTELVLRDWKRAHPGPVGVPVSLEDNVLELVGADYASTARGTGVQRFRYSEREPNSFLVHVEYVVPFSPGFDPWHTEQVRCEKYARAVL